MKEANYRGDSESLYFKELESFIQMQIDKNLLSYQQAQLILDYIKGSVKKDFRYGHSIDQGQLTTAIVAGGWGTNFKDLMPFWMMHAYMPLLFYFHINLLIH